MLNYISSKPSLDRIFRILILNKEDMILWHFYGFPTEVSHTSKLVNVVGYEILSQRLKLTNNSPFFGSYVVCLDESRGHKSPYEFEPE